MVYKLGKRSNRELIGVDFGLIAVVQRAIEITTQDFSVHDGIRTRDEQLALVDAGASQTMDSKHLIGEAVDLVPYINGKMRWEWGPIYEIAKAMRTASREVEIPLRWGGAWDVVLTEDYQSPEAMVKAYVKRRRKKGKRAFIDGPHYERAHA